MMSFRGVGTIGLSNAEHILVEVLWSVTGFDGSVLPLRRQASLISLFVASAFPTGSCTHPMGIGMVSLLQLHTRFIKQVRMQ